MTAILELNGNPVTHFDNAERKVKWSKPSIYGHTVYGSLRSIAHLDDTSKRCEQQMGHEVEIIQGAYNTDIPASAGTHDYDAVYDVFVPMADWLEAQRFLRVQGWAAFWRHPPIFTNHIHMVSLGYTTKVGIYVPGQVDDYYNHRNAMVGHDPDYTWHPEDIRATIFDYHAWEQDQEGDMPLNAEDKQWLREMVAEEIKQQVPKIAAEVMNSHVNPDGATARAALRAAKATPGLIKDLGSGQTPKVPVDYKDPGDPKP